jgi:integrase
MLLISEAITVKTPLEIESKSGNIKTFKTWQRRIPQLESPHLSPRDTIAENSTMSLELFVATKFIPEHVETKNTAGRRHYYAILKHVLHPEKIDRMFSPDTEKVRARMKSLLDWPYLDNVRLCDLQPAHVRQLTASALAHGYSTQTILHIRNVISAIISHAKREKCFDGDNPTLGVTLPPMARGRAQNLTIVQAKRMLQLMGYPEREIALMAIITGMSVSEICGLQWKYVNLTDSKIYVDGAAIAPRSILVKNRQNSAGLVGVNAHRVRTIDIPEPLYRTLLSLKQQQNDPDPNLLVSPSWDGRPVNPYRLRMQRLRPIGRKLEMPGLSWQILTRAHNALMSELRTQFYDDLTISAE